MSLFQQAIETSNKPLSELELFFGSICMTVGKLSPLEQARIKMQISNIVSQAELSQLQQSELIPPNSYHTTDSTKHYPYQMMNLQDNTTTYTNL